MRKIYFENILIADIVEKKACFHQFKKGINIITSKENHVGKSSLLKSLYYSMGAEVKFDDIWDKNTKLCVVEFYVNEEKFKIVRLGKSFALFNELELILTTKSVSQDLTEKFKEIFLFSIYLSNKKTAKIELAPPVFTFMPYYIDQDSGWSGLYESFSNIEQYKKNDRIKSLYYHLGIYTLLTVELTFKKDNIRERIELLKKDEEKIRITLDSLYLEIQNLVPANSIEELEKNLEISKDHISSLVNDAGRIRNIIQKLETDLSKHEYYLKIVREYKMIKNQSNLLNKQRNVFINECPKCGYDFGDEIYNIVCLNYNIQNSEYMYTQIKQIVSKIKLELDMYKKDYVNLMNNFRKQEQVYDEKQDSYDVYLRHKGLQNSVKRFNKQLMENVFKRNQYENEIKIIENELKKLINKKEIEEIYIDNVRRNIIKLGAWNPEYEGKIKLLKAIQSQGTLETKIISSQMIGIFQTMEYFKTNTILLPLVIDSPRAKEASYESSKDILELIFEMNLPQVILATIDYENFDSDVNLRAENVIILDKKRGLLEFDIYHKYKNVIEDLKKLIE